MKKKAQVSTLPSIIILLVLAGTFLIFGLIILEKIRDTGVVSESLSVTLINETVTRAELSAGSDSVTLDAALANSGYCAPQGYGIVSVFNNTDGVVMTSGNYSLSSSGVFTNLTIPNGTWDVSYSFTSGADSCLVANQTVVGLGTFGDFWEIIVLAIVIGIVIGLLLVVFGGSRSR